MEWFEDDVPLRWWMSSEEACVSDFIISEYYQSKLQVCAKITAPDIYEALIVYDSRIFNEAKVKTRTVGSQVDVMLECKDVCLIAESVAL